MSYVFTFRKTKAKTATIQQYIGTWQQFERDYPKAILINTPQEIS